MFDHGCDAFTTGFLVLMVAKLVQVGNNQWVLLGLIAVCQSFYFATLVEYYTGGLFLGLGNGVTDGSVPLIAIFFFSGIVGN